MEEKKKYVRRQKCSTIPTGGFAISKRALSLLTVNINTVRNIKMWQVLHISCAIFKSEFKNN